MEKGRGFGHLIRLGLACSAGTGLLGTQAMRSALSSRLSGWLGQVGHFPSDIEKVAQ